MKASYVELSVPVRCSRIVNALGLSVGLTGASIRMEAKRILGKCF